MNFDSNSSIEEFKLFSRKNRLRLIEDENNLPIAVSKKHKNNKYADQMYEGFNQCFGIFIQRPTAQRKKNLCKKLIDLGCIVKQNGDAEACLIVPKENALEVAKFLKLQKKDKPKNSQNILKARLKLNQNQANRALGA